MSQKITLTGTPITPPRLMKEWMGREVNATKVFAFEMEEGGSPGPAKGLPKASRIQFTVFANEKQLKKAGLDEKKLMRNKVLIQGELVIDLTLKTCPGEMGVTATQIQMIPSKPKPAEEKTAEVQE